VVKLHKRKESPETPDEVTAPDTPLLPLDDLIPNTWNPNTMTDEEYAKTKRGIKKLIKKVGLEKLPPLVVRPHPKKKLRAQGKWQIIDGEHRQRILTELGYDKAPVLVLRVNTRISMLLTDQLNHNRGSNDPKKYAHYLKKLVHGYGMSLTELEEQLPHTAEDMETMMQAQNIRLDDVMIHGQPDEEAPEAEDDEHGEWVKMEFRVPPEVAELVEAEIGRISSRLEGRNIRGRALEFMAVGSAQTPLKSIFGGRDTAMKALSARSERRRRKRRKETED
jgi:hypothetical protein